MLKKVLEKISQKLANKYYQINKEKSRKISEIIKKQDKEKQKKILEEIKNIKNLML